MLYIVRALQETIIHYKYQYLEDDFYRMKKVVDVVGVYKTPKEKRKAYCELYNNMMFSAFKGDRCFVLNVMV